MEHLSSLQLDGRGDQVALYHRPTDHSPDMLAFVWVDKNRRYFISTCSNMRPAEPIYRERWRQVASLESNEPAVKVALEIPQPNCSKVYYDGCGLVDQHNRKRQDDLNLEKKLGTHDWSKRVNMSIFGMLVVDAYLMYRGCTQEESPQTMNEFIHKLADELIDWRQTTRAQRTAYHFHRLESPPSKKRSIEVVHLSPTKRMKPTASPRHRDSGKRVNSYCRECKTRRTTMLCSHCWNPEVPICDTNRRHECWVSHCDKHHMNELVNVPSAAKRRSNSSKSSHSSTMSSTQGSY